MCCGGPPTWCDHTCKGVVAAGCEGFCCTQHSPSHVAAVSDVVLRLYVQFWHAAAPAAANLAYPQGLHSAAPAAALNDPAAQDWQAVVPLLYVPAAHWVHALETKPKPLRHTAQHSRHGQSSGQQQCCLVQLGPVCVACGSTASRVVSAALPPHASQCTADQEGRELRARPLTCAGSSTGGRVCRCGFVAWAGRAAIQGVASRIGAGLTSSAVSSSITSLAHWGHTNRQQQAADTGVRGAGRHCLGRVWQEAGGDGDIDA